MLGEATCKPLRLLPTFSYACEGNPTFLSLLATDLGRLGIALPFDPQQGSYRQYSGDASVPGKGEILVWQPRA